MKDKDYLKSEEIINASLGGFMGKTLTNETKGIELFHTFKGAKTFAPLLVAPNIEYIRIRTDAKIPEFDSIVELNKLRKIVLEGNLTINSLTALEKFPKLKELELQKIFPLLDGLKLNIEKLEIASTTLDKVSYLRNMPNLKHVSLGNSVIYTNINDSTDFSAIKQIEYLYILSRSLTKLDNLKVLKNLRSLWIPANRKLKSIEGIQEMNNLDVFAFYRTDVKDLSPVSGLNLKYISGGETNIKTLKGVHLKDIIRLELNSTLLKKFDAESMPNLEYLSLFNTPLNSLNELENFSSIKQLSLESCNDISDFSILGKMPNLEILDLHKISIPEDTLIKILDAPKLKIINVEGNDAIKNIEPNSAITKARERNIHFCYKNREYAEFMRNYDKRFGTLAYYMHLFEGDKNKWTYLSDKGFHV
ncbi:hypothetical protein SAMN05421780_101118 [Flexibacter flexilis DSM 6793]|uniref:Leucine-rich repeat domain-containing protein n=1 Tax=Flexibacter flexilis DSM 6793 TaxID=927664 RepID=A0A1I1DC84_9BACT|nr:leucine-rich repeat domain-containing protein [Flexibacter flexilis]SFB72531.1 hypothetical protein SAMN05421780_101118 [Flexibacter flexilis DSM 6793]